MSSHTKSARAMADVAFEKTQSQARERNKVKGEREAVAQAADDKIARLKAERLKRGASPEPKKAPSWGDLNAALNALVKEGLIVSYSTAKSARSDVPAIEVTIGSGADQAEVVRRVRGSLPAALSEAQVRTRVG